MEPAMQEDLNEDNDLAERRRNITERLAASGGIRPLVGGLPQQQSRSVPQHQEEASEPNEELSKGLKGDADEEETPESEAERRARIAKKLAMQGTIRPIFGGMESQEPTQSQTEPVVEDVEQPKLEVEEQHLETPRSADQPPPVPRQRPRSFLGRPSSTISPPKTPPPTSPPPDPPIAPPSRQLPKLEPPTSQQSTRHGEEDIDDEKHKSSGEFVRVPSQNLSVTTPKTERDSFEFVTPPKDRDIPSPRSGKSPTGPRPAGKHIYTHDELVQLSQSLGRKINEFTKAQYELSKNMPIADGTSIGFVTETLAFCNAASDPENWNFGHLIHSQNAQGIVKRLDDPRVGDILVLKHSEFKGRKAFGNYKSHFGANGPQVAFVAEYELKKGKVKFFNILFPDVVIAFRMTFIKRFLQITDRGIRLNDKHISWPIIRDADLEGLHPSTTQKTWATTDVPVDSKPLDARFDEQSQTLSVNWHDTPGLPKSSQYNLKTLSEAFSSRPWQTFPPHIPAAKPWSVKEFTNNSQHFDVAELYESPSMLLKALTQLHERGLIFINNVPTEDTTDAGCGLRRMAESLFGELRNTFYGQTWDVRALGGQSRNVAYTGLDLKYHMDLLYFESPPRFQFLHSLKALTKEKSPQGHSLFLDSYKAAEELSHQSQQLLRSVPIVYEYDNDNHHYIHSHPVLQEFGSNLQSVNYSPPFQSPHQPFIAELEPETQVKYLNALREWNNLLDRQDLNLETRLSEGDCVVFDNRRVLHARRAFDEQGGQDEIVRWLKGTYVDGDAIWDRWRVVKEITLPHEIDICRLMQMIQCEMFTKESFSCIQPLTYDDISSPSTINMSSAVQILTDYRKEGVRRSQETYNLSKQIYGTRHERSLGDEKWAFYEQFAIAALDVGDHNLAEELLLRLAEKFPLSPRVSVIEGMMLEAKREFGLAERLYNNLLEEDPTNVAIQKRMIVLTKLQYPKDLSKATDRLTTYLDTFYLDPEAWMELADIYTQQQSYQRALFAIEECLLMQPINPYYILKYAETQYTSGDFHEAYNSYLRVVELQDSFPRAWLGLKMCCRKLLKYPHNEQPEHLSRVDVLATKMSLDMYTSSSTHKVDDDTRKAVLKFVE
ncbi:hypothetical protein E3P94_04078 [Wallemia ichthyophaga]|nr:hypothetical protein E3P94_04078 [Wallemia ichthyophaga]